MFYKKKIGTPQENLQQILKPGWPWVNPGSNAFQGSLQWFPGLVERDLDLPTFVMKSITITDQNLSKIGINVNSPKKMMFGLFGFLTNVINFHVFLKFFPVWGQ